MNDKTILKRFDAVEFNVLRCASSGQYYRGDEEVERAKLLMQEEILKVNPEDNWWNTGWKLTYFGEIYWQYFLECVREKHGHVWMTHNDTEGDWCKADEYANSIDLFAYEIGYHNGPRCKKCGFGFCYHCTNEFEIPECSYRPIEG